MHIKSWTLVLCTMHDNFRGSRLGSSLTKLHVQAIAECSLQRVIIKNVLYLIQLPFSLVISVLMDISCFPGGLKIFVVQKQLALLFLDVY